MSLATATGGVTMIGAMAITALAGDASALEYLLGMGSGGAVGFAAGWVPAIRSRLLRCLGSASARRVAARVRGKMPLQDLQGEPALGRTRIF
jgi:hypothetical protein